MKLGSSTPARIAAPIEGSGDSSGGIGRTSSQIANIAAADAIAPRESTKSGSSRTIKLPSIAAATPATAAASDGPANARTAAASAAARSPIDAMTSGCGAPARSPIPAAAPAQATATTGIASQVFGAATDSRYGSAGAGARFRWSPPTNSVRPILRASHRPVVAIAAVVAKDPGEPTAATTSAANI